MFVLGLIIAGSIGVIAVNLSANDISYGNGTVKDALDELYTSSRGVSCLYLSGTKGQVGSKYICDPGDGVARNFYILKVDTDEVKLIMERNLSDEIGNVKTMSYSDANSFISNNNINTSWKNAKSVSLPSIQDIANAGGITGWDVTTATTSNWSYFGVNSQNDTRKRSNYIWLYDYTRECSSYECTNSLSSSYAYGYWSNDLIQNDSTRAWNVFRGGYIGYDTKTIDTHYGVRPVITMEKTQLN